MRSFFIQLFIVFIYFINCINCEEIVINVGDHGLKFSPQNTTAKVNDVIRWVFIGGAGKHQIVQSDGPTGSCKNSSDPNLFASPLQEGGEYTYQITQTSGMLYYFCAYSSHCQYGMWGTIKIDQSSVVPLSSQTASSPTPTIANPSTSDDNLPMIIGSAIGGFFALSILGLIGFMIYRRRKYHKQFEDDAKDADGDDGNIRSNNLSSGSATESVSTLVNTGLTRSNTANTRNYRGEPNNEVIIINDRDRLGEETMKSYDEINSEYGGRNSEYGSILNRGSKSDSYQYRPYSDGSMLSSNPPYDTEKQPPVIPPRPYNTGSSQFGAPYIPPRPSVANKYPPQYGPSLSSYRDTQYSTSSDPFGTANIQYYQPNDVLPQQLPPPSQPPSQPLPPIPSPPRLPPQSLHPPPSQLLHPPPSQPLPPPPSQQQTGQYYS